MLSILVGLGIVAQAVIGGVSVLTRLNPWVVGLHLAASVLLILWCVDLVHSAWRLAPVEVGARLAVLTRGVFAWGMVVVALGVVVTGAGPNAGDGAALRNGLSLEWTAKAHAWAVWLLVGLTLAGVVWSAGHPRARRLYVGLLAVEVLQGVIGYVQYFLHLPVAVVFAHLVGTSLFAAALCHVWLLVRPATRADADADAASPRVSAGGRG